jgi:hypothetical protein
MSVKILSLVLENGPTDALEKLVMVVIADHADDSGGHAFPGIQLIARKSCQSPRNAMRVLASLELAGWLSIQRKSHLGKGNLYQLNVPRLRTELVIRDTVSPVRRNTQGNKATSVASSDTMSPMLKSAEAAKSGDKPGDSQVTNSTGSGDKNAVPFNSINRQEPPLEPKATTTPLPPSQARWKKVSPSHRGTCEDAVSMVMRELNLSERRMAAVIARAIAAHRAKTIEPPGCWVVAESMVKARHDYLGLSSVLKFQVGVRKFFAQGVWADERLWVVDREQIQRQRRL